MLGFLILSYRQTIKAYPSAGGAYIVTRDNFGLLPAQVAGVALLTDYVLTVAVSVAAGSDALASAIPSLAPYKHWIAIGFVCVIAYGNLRGTKESGRLFAAPTYLFIVNMFVLIAIGVVREVTAGLPKRTDVGRRGHDRGRSEPRGGLLPRRDRLVALKAFGSGGAAVTGVEAISNGVPAFRASRSATSATCSRMVGCCSTTFRFASVTVPLRRSLARTAQARPPCCA